MRRQERRQGTKQRWSTLLLFMAAVAIGLGLAEFALRALDRPRHRPAHVLCDCPYLYEQNPARPDVGPQGLRDRKFAIPKPPGVFRVLALGDSVTWGVNVPAPQTFAKVLEQLLAGRRQRVEVVNAGVLGYTAYNELQYYRAKGRIFEPDLVLIAFCMNDVVDPELHWSDTPREVPEVPLEAIPNREYHATHVRALLGPSLPFIGRRSYLLRRLERLGDPRARPEWREGRFVTIAGRRWPTYLTQEDDLGIQVLTDYESPEWRWLRRIYARLDDAVTADGGRLVVLVMPLSYQLEDGYPFKPEREFARYCRETGVACVDALAPLREHRDEGVFPPAGGDGGDIWHLTTRGHEVIARTLERSLTAAGLVPPARMADHPLSASVHEHAHRTLRKHAG
jgi:GDSL-like Lipase/Acylhydrolase family